MNKQKIDSSIFKTYDIRGIYPDQIDPDIAYRIGRAYAQLIQSEIEHNNPVKIAVSNDMRLSSPQLKGFLIKGLIDSGITVVDIGFNSSPTFYFAVGCLKLDGGIQVSASHNPKQYNGFKLVKANAIPISGDTGIEQIKDLAIKNDFPNSEPGRYTTATHITDKLIKHQAKKEDLESIKPLKIVVDAANSVAKIDVETIFNKLPQVELVKLNFKLDGRFPAHPADPLEEENLKSLKEAVLEHNADLGIAPDGDGDRYFFIDEKGNVVRQEILRGIMAQIILEEKPNSVICYDIRPGKITLDMIKNAGGQPSVTRVGHSLIKEQMIKEDAPFGGESSGHYFYKTEYGTFEAPVILLTKFLRFISQKDKPLSEIIKPLQKYHHSGEINSKVKDPQAKIIELEEKFSDANDISKLDGITITYDDFWFNVRPSNTEPKLRLNLEAVDKETMEEKRDLVLNLIRS